MVRFPSEWRAAYGVDLVTAFAPELGARFRWYERLVPQPTFSAVVERVISSDPDFRIHRIGDTVRAVTHEGEYAAWVAVEGRRQGAEARRFIGAVFVDHFGSALDCVALVSRHFPQLHQVSFDVLRSARYGMASRPRPFFHQPPPGWQALPSGASVTWYPLDFPENLTNIAVPHAEVLEGSAEVAVEADGLELGAGLEIEEQHRAVVATTNGVPGTLFTVRGRRAGRAEPILRELATFIVDHRVYRVRLETTRVDRLAELRELFRAVVLSIRPLPSADEVRRGHAFVLPSTDLDHWAT